MTITYDEIREHHVAIYDRLAAEYDDRVPKLAAVSSASLDNFAPYLNGRRVLDIGCGAGGVMELLNQRGYLTDGIDISPKMVEVTQRRNPNSKVFCGDLLDLEVEPYDGLVAFALIHLFPKPKALEVLQKMRDLLVEGGVMLIGSTSEKESGEGFLAKRDYEGAPERFRKRWTKSEIEVSFDEVGFSILDVEEHYDPYGKIWLDYVVRKTA